jgi:2-keto-4-pentenoate hydratase/2-oxohepta-3-ene-1,7-dioic acid hydratase in catechol pathway
MKLALYDAGAGAGPRVGVVHADGVIDAGVEGGLVDLMALWPGAKAAIEARVAGAPARPLSAVKLLAPVPRPGKIFAIGLNYADHIAESRAETPAHQVWFTKAVTAVNPPVDPIQIARGAPFVDYEVELVAVIGRRARHVSRAEAPGVIFGYCVGNDVTERLWQHRTAQWSLGKSFDTHAPVGPWITTADEVGDPHQLEIRCLVNGEVRQASNTRNLVFDVFEQIEHLSQAMTLEPGDLIFTGTPGGVGAAMDPRRFLKPGDIVRCEIEGLGAIEAPLVAEA